MKFQVVLQPLAEADLEAAYLWAARHAPETAARWLARFQGALQQIGDNPRRFGFATEHKLLKREVRQMLFGKKPNVFRSVFVIEDGMVRVLRIRRAAQARLTRRELG